MGRSLTVASSTISGSLSGREAPETMSLIPSRTEVSIRSRALLSTPMILIAMGPSVMLLARRISSISASRETLSKSVLEASISPSPTEAMVPIPPSLATAAASRASETRTPMPPWMRGNGARISPMSSGGIFILYLRIS